MTAELGYEYGYLAINILVILETTYSDAVTADAYLKGVRDLVSTSLGYDKYTIIRGLLMAISL